MGGGAERSVLTLHQSLLDLGHDSRLLVGSKRGNEPGVVEIDRNRPIPGVLRVTRRLESSGLQNLYSPWFRALSSQLAGTDVVHMHSLWKSRENFADLTGVKQIASEFPTVMTLRDSWMLTGHCACPVGCQRWQTGCGRCPDLARTPAVQRDWTAMNWRRKRRTVQRTNLYVTTVSHWLKDEVTKSPIFKEKPIHVVHNSINEDAFQPADREQKRQSLSIPPNRFVVLLVAKGIDGPSYEAIDALNALDPSKFHLLLVSKPNSISTEQLSIPTTILSPRMTEAEMAECYQASDVTVVPSYFETFGRVAAESLFCGTPVIAYRTGGLPEIINDGCCGRTIDPGDTTALINELKTMASHPQQLEEMRAECVAHSRPRFNRNRIATDYLSVYRQAADS